MVVHIVVAGEIGEGQKFIEGVFFDMKKAQELKEEIEEDLEDADIYSCEVCE